MPFDAALMHYRLVHLTTWRLSCMSLQLCAESVKGTNSRLRSPAPSRSGVESAENKGACKDIVALVSVAGAKK